VILHVIHFARELLQYVFAFHCGPAQVVPMGDVNRCWLGRCKLCTAAQRMQYLREAAVFCGCHAQGFEPGVFHKVSLTAPLKKLPLFQVGWSVSRKQPATNRGIPKK
jgi:hypothetical protein